MLDVLFLSLPPQGLFIKAGGSAANLGRVLAGEGRPVTIIGKLGSDPNGRWVAGELGRLGVALPAAPGVEAPTGYVVMHRRDGVDRVVYVERGTNALLGLRDVEQVTGEGELGGLDGVAWLHVSGYCLIEEGPAEVARRLALAARRRGIPVSLDPGVRRAFRRLDRKGVLHRLGLGLDGGPDVLLPSADMAVFLAGGAEGGAPGPGEASVALGRVFRRVVVKDGPRGAWLEGVRVGPEHAVSDLQADVSGAGDVFDAAYIVSVLAGCAPEEAVVRAVGEAGRFVAASIAPGSAPGPGWVRVGSQRPPVLASACLLGAATAYDGGPRGPWDAARHGPLDPGERLVLPICPECLGGLGVPRAPAEITGGDGEAVIAGKARVVTRDGRDVSEVFLKGARRAVELARATGAQRAVLKDGSPSCGPTRIHDGTFTGRSVPGRGVAAAALRLLGVEVEPDAAKPGRAGYA
ncbi:MAG TPA: hypothetical protein DGR79_04695 [Clostridiales bacterium]|nr:hypothetical protein [Clostridiales bacterium]